MATIKKTIKTKSKTARIKDAGTGVGVSRGFIIFLVLSTLSAGLYALVSSRGQVYPVSEQVPWAILGSTCALFAAASTGLYLLAIAACAIGGRSMTSFVNRSLFLSIASAFATGMILLIHYAVTGGSGQSPWNTMVSQVFSPDLVSQVVSPDSTSNIWWIRTLMAGTVGSMLVMFYANARGHSRMALLVGGAGGLAALGANMSLGAMVSSALLVRPVWYGGGQLGLYFLFSSLMAGAATFILLTHLSHALHGTLIMRQETRRNLEIIGQVLTMSAYAVLVATAWRYFSAFMESASPARPTADVLVHGLLSANFWGFEIVIGLVVPILLLTLIKVKSLSIMSTASIMILVGVVFQRYDMLIAGRLIPVEVEWRNIGMTFSYLPSLGELLLVVSGIGLVGASLLFGEWLFGTDFRYSES